MQALKVLVVGLTILIVFAMTVIAYGLYRKADEPDFKFFSFGGGESATEAAGPAALPSPVAGSPMAPMAATAQPRAFGEAMLALPAGCNIAAVSGDGARIFLKIGPAGGACERVIIVNANSGALLGTLKVAP